MKPKYQTWIRMKKTISFIIIFIIILVFAFQFNNIYLTIFLLLITAAFIYMCFIVLVSYYYLSSKGGNYQSKVHDEIIKRIKKDKSILILDIGAGSGSLSIKAAKRDKTYKIKAIDYWGSDWEYSKDRCEDNAKIEKVEDQIEFIKASASSLPFDDNTFDTVISCLTFHEVKDTANKTKVLLEAIRVLKNSGQFIFFDVFNEEKIFGSYKKIISDLKKYAEIVEEKETKDIFNNIPRILLSKKVLGDAVMIVGIKNKNY